jgi:hypothetical protein
VRERRADGREVVLGVSRDPRPKRSLALGLAEPLEIHTNALDARDVGPLRQADIVRPEREDEVVSW